jgi:hypothetical protein
MKQANSRASLMPLPPVMMIHVYFKIKIGIEVLDVVITTLLGGKAAKDIVFSTL